MHVFLYSIYTNIYHYEVRKYQQIDVYIYQCVYPLQNALDLNILGQTWNNLFQQILVKKEEILEKEEDSHPWSLVFF